jgi:hypothetical protein
MELGIMRFPEHGFATVYRKSIPLFVLFFISTVLSSGQAQDLRPRVTYEKGLLSASARNIDLKELLAMVAERTKIQISSPEPIQKTVTVEFSNLPLEKGLSLILKDVNHIFMFSQSDSKTEAETLYRVIVLPKEVKGPTSPDTRPPQQQGIVPEQEPGQRQGEQTENTGTGEGQEPDPVVKRYQMQLEKLEQELAQVEEDSPRGKAITEQMIRLEEQMERRIHGSE